MSTHTQLAEMIREAGDGGVLAITGAGVSVPSGVPDFRSAGGLWEKQDPMKVAHIDVWRENPALFWSYYSERLEIADGLIPNGAHTALAKLEEMGYLRGVVTQNIDGLHQSAGSENVVEIHGSVRHLVSACGFEVTREESKALFAPDGVPYCPECEMPLKPDVVLFGEFLPEGAYQRATTWLGRVSLVLAIGTSLVVEPVASLPRYAQARGSSLALITKGWTPYHSTADLILDGEVDFELAEVLAHLA